MQSLYTRQTDTKINVIIMKVKIRALIMYIIHATKYIFNCPQFEKISTPIHIFFFSIITPTFPKKKRIESKMPMIKTGIMRVPYQLRNFRSFENWKKNFFDRALTMMIHSELEFRKFVQV